VKQDHNRCRDPWDRRITDTALMAKALTGLEQVLNTEMAAELRGHRQQPGIQGFSDVQLHI
jgi:hypothetical protein